MRISTSIHALRIPFRVPVGPGIAVDRAVHVYLLCGDRVCLIDSGVAGSEGAVFEYLERIGRSPEEISTLVLTHSHPDHVGAARAIREATGCRVGAHPAERAWIEDVDLQAKERPVPGFPSLVGGSVPVDLPLEEGSVLDLGGGVRLETFHTPGHSKGSISLLLPGEGALFTGDAVPVPGDVPIYEDFEASVRSIGKLRGIEGLRHLCGSWDAPRAGDRVRETMDAGLRYLLRIREAVSRLAGRESPADPMELCRRVLEELGIAPAAANPLVARSFVATLKALEEGKRG